MQPDRASAAKTQSKAARTPRIEESIEIIDSD
jgi:hypothetical protein